MNVIYEGDGDLISRSYLKNLPFERVIHTDFGDTAIPIEEIDNAPTVEPEKIAVANVTLDKEQLEEIVEKAKAEVLASIDRPQGEWIPVSERMPEEKQVFSSGSDFGFDFEEVLCTTIWGDVRSYKFGKPIGHDKPHFWFGGGIMDEYVIAWQYKPEPYKKGGAK